MPGKSIESGSRRIPFETRFEFFTIPEPNSGCLIWLGPLNNSGYGQMKTGYKSEGTRRTYLVHRIAYEHFVGPIPEKMDLDHLCRVRCCVNPAHLEPVTRRENNLRGIGPQVHRARKAAQQYCKRGHQLFGDNMFLNSEGKRACKACRKQLSEKYRRQRAVN